MRAIVLGTTAVLAAVLTACSPRQAAGTGRETAPGGVCAKTTFQTACGWSPFLDNRADAVMVYGVGGNPSAGADERDGASLEARLASWRERGYRADFMTGIAWGGYEDYFTGGWDGASHMDEGQKNAAGDTIWHGRMVPYIVPSRNYLAYFKQTQIKRVIDAGVDDIFLEEPEFWSAAGYSEAFKREWEACYGAAWRPQDESPEATYLSAKLKYHLYYRALDEVFSYAKEYGRSLGREIRCYVPTHSLINYAQWGIVSPEASLASLPCVDGYIAQVWTGTARVPNHFNGVLKERVFENAFLEYGCMASMTAPTGRRLWFLTDPVEDSPRDWTDYKRNYQATFTAQLMYPQVADYEIMPWPERIYRGYYPKSATDSERIRIPQEYASMMQIMIGAARDMPAGKTRVDGEQGISVLMANSLMFQHFPIHDGYEDPQLAGFFGLAMPLLKRGVPVGITHIENLAYASALRDVRVLLMSYSNMKPLDPEAHRHLAEWVRKGGRLIYCGRDADPFQGVQEWWNREGNAFAAPADHLFSLLDVPAGAPEGRYACGKGTLQILRRDPKEFVLVERGDTALLTAVSALYGRLETKNHFTLARGPYLLAAVLDESVSEEPLRLKGRFIDLYDPALPVCDGATLAPGSQGLYYNLRKAPRAPAILAAAGRAYEIQNQGRCFSYRCKGPLETVHVTRILLPKQPRSVRVAGEAAEYEWDPGSRTCLLRFANDPEGVPVEIRW